MALKDTNQNLFWKVVKIPTIPMINVSEGNQALIVVQRVGLVKESPNVLDDPAVFGPIQGEKK